MAFMKISLLSLIEDGEVESAFQKGDNEAGLRELYVCTVRTDRARDVPTRNGKYVPILVGGQKRKGKPEAVETPTINVRQLSVSRSKICITGEQLETRLQPDAHCINTSVASFPALVPSPPPAPSQFLHPPGAMGFFTFLGLLACHDTPSVLAYLPALASHLVKSPKTIGNDVTPEKTAHQNTRCHALPSTLPLEIVLSIIEAAAYSDTSPDVALLRCCSLVCRAWSTPAQKLLFTSVSLRSESAYISFRHAVDRSTEHGRLLGDAVVRLRVIVDHNQPLGLSQRSFAQAVTMCPNLFELNIALYGRATPGDVGMSDMGRMRRPAPSFDDDTLTLLRSGPMITALQFSNWSENQHSTTQLLDIWPTLRSLTISGTPPQPPSPFIEPFQCSLEELRMNFQSPPSFDFINWLLHNSSNTLRVLEIEREPSVQVLNQLVDTHGATLHSLSLPSCHLPEYAQAIQKCSQLRELRFENPMISAKLWKALPETLEHIALGVNVNTSVQPLVDVIRKSETLRAVTIHATNRGDQHPLFPVLKMVSTYQGLSMKVVQDSRIFRSHMRGDPVPSLIYPRTQSLANLRIMRS
ncbi:hypothetical protein H0H81_002228 [Sphagnurus paluster]|uniref:F-box domain-containing protein n=1 Tax=Sphagnurus paluster TaxID=117069 RepID=A0A9P7FSY7_9AGAR|nr:hypothetical protein H0H81_002228 [Sphagnurus paluster]